MRIGRGSALAALLSLAAPVAARAADADAGAPPPPAVAAPPPAAVAPAPAPAGETAPPAYETVVTATTPLHGSRLPRDRVPANVQTVTAEAIAAQHSLDLSAYMNDAVGSVHVNQVQANPLQPDLQYRGFLASPVLGAPQGLSVYLDGARLNEPFGDTVNWDLIPTGAIRSVNVIPGSNPIFGLNTLGGALSIETKTGFSDPGAAARAGVGSFGRRLLDFGVGAHGERFALFAAGQLFGEDGWRRFSPTQSANVFVDAGYARGPTTANLTLMLADTSLTGNGPAPEQLLALDRTAVFTYPDRTQNRMLMAIARGERPVAARARLTGVAYVRAARMLTVNGDQRDWSACQAQPGVLCSVGAGGNEAPVLDAAGNPVAFDPSYDAADNGTATRQLGVGVAAQLAVEAPLAGRENHLFVGAAADQAWIHFRAQSTVATLDPSRGAVDTGFLDPLSPVAVDAAVQDLGIYAADTFALRRDMFLTLSARFNVAALSLDDRLGGALGGDHQLHRLNPAAGLSWQPLPALGGYAGYSESARAPTPIELTCASETDPCRLPNGFVADPPLAQVVARTFEAGVRGTARARATVDYAVAAFRTSTDDDIQFISSGRVANQGYFANVGSTRRQGIEASLTGRWRPGGRRGQLGWVLRYTLLEATFETPFSALSANHPDAVNGAIAVPAGARMPGIPTHLGKAVVSWIADFGLVVGANVTAQSSQVLRGDEANLLAPLPGYVVCSLQASYRIARPLAVFAVVSNVFDAHYSTFGVLGDAAGVLGPGFTSPRFVGPGAPRAFWFGVDLAY
jgi:outer membrane receptor protein involved in Fe transport